MPMFRGDKLCVGQRLKVSKKRVVVGGLCFAPLENLEAINVGNPLNLRCEAASDLQDHIWF